MPHSQHVRPLSVLKQRCRSLDWFLFTTTTVQRDCDILVKAPKAKLPTNLQLYLSW